VVKEREGMSEWGWVRNDYQKISERKTMGMKVHRTEGRTMDGEFSIRASTSGQTKISVFKSTLSIDERRLQHCSHGWTLSFIRTTCAVEDPKRSSESPDNRRPRHPDNHHLDNHRLDNRRRWESM
jgi:hypothetical protein